MSDLSRLFAPESIALVGISSDPTKYGGRALHHLKTHGFDGQIVLVNPNHGEIDSLPTVPSVTAGGATDVAVIMVGRAHVETAVREAAEVGTRFAVIMTGGFRESGTDGAALQDRLRAVVRDTAIRLVGPNSAGLLSTRSRTVATLLSCARMPVLPAGPIGIVAQSGTACSVATALAVERQLGVSHAIATGNEVDVTASEAIVHLVRDADTRVILTYLEQVRDPAVFRQALAEAAAAEKPIVCLRAGSSETGRRAVASHTGALAGLDEVYEAVFERFGVLRVRDFDEMMDLAEGFVRVGSIEGDRLFVITVGSGGGAAIAADLADEHGLELPGPSEGLTRELAAEVSPLVTVANPLDAAGLRGSADDEPVTMARCVAAVAESGEYDASLVMVPLVPYGRDVADELSRVRRAQHPLITAWVGGEGLRAGVDRARRSGIASYGALSGAVRVASRLSSYARARRNRQRGDDPIEPDDGRVADARLLLNQALTPLSEVEARGLLRLYDIDAPREQVVREPADAVEAAESIGYPVAVKLLSRGLNHKSDVGGVVLGVGDREDVERAFRQIRAAATSAGIETDGVLIQEMASGFELLVGAVVHHDLGPTITVAAGGIYAEILNDAAVRLAPLSLDASYDAITGLRVASLLRGARGQDAANIAAAASVVHKLSVLVIELADELSAIEINPLVVSQHSALAVDALVEGRARKVESSV